MPRTQQADFLMVHKFQLVDVSVTIPPIFLPAYGFSAVTAPELTLDMQNITEGNFEYPRKVFKKASVNNIICSRGAQLQDNDFWTWIDNYLQGKRDKKNLLLIQSTMINESSITGSAITNSLPGPLKSIGNSVLGGVSTAASALGFGLTKPGRAWLLKNCSPGRYKAASDFDARTTGISIAELEIVYEWFNEFNTGLLGG
jgi:phage tail-like protein